MAKTFDSVFRFSLPAFTRLALCSGTAPICDALFSANIDDTIPSACICSIIRSHASPLATFLLAARASVVNVAPPLLFVHGSVGGGRHVNDGGIGSCI